LFEKHQLQSRTLKRACLCKWMTVNYSSKVISTDRKAVIPLYLRHCWMTWKELLVLAKRNTTLILFVIAARSDVCVDQRNKQVVQTMNKLKSMISLSRYVNKTVFDAERRCLLKKRKTHWLVWTQVACCKRKQRLLTFRFMERNSLSLLFRIFLGWCKTGFCLISRLNEVESRFSCATSVTKTRYFWRWTTNTKNEKIIRSEGSTYNLESDVSNMKTVLGESKYLDWDRAWIRVKEDRPAQVEQLNTNCRTSPGQESVNFERIGSTLSQDIRGQTNLSQAPVIRSLKFENPSDKRYESSVKDRYEHQYFEGELRDGVDICGASSAINPRQQQHRNVDSRIENQLQHYSLSGLKQQDKITSIKNERPQLIEEIGQLKSSSQNMLSEQHRNPYEVELNWLFQEIKRIQNVMDLDLIRSLPEPIQLERCFVSAEVCLSFCVRALIRLGSLLKKHPRADRSHGAEFCLFDVSVYD
jgi:hypothetical protein